MSWRVAGGASPTPTHMTRPADPPPCSPPTAHPPPTTTHHNSARQRTGPGWPGHPVTPSPQTPLDASGHTLRALDTRLTATSCLCRPICIESPGAIALGTLFRLPRHPASPSHPFLLFRFFLRRSRMRQHPTTTTSNARPPSFDTSPTTCVQPVSSQRVQPDLPGVQPGTEYRHSSHLNTCLATTATHRDFGMLIAHRSLCPAEAPPPDRQWSRSAKHAI